MPPKEKRATKPKKPTSVEPEPEEPLEYASYVRERCGKRAVGTGGRTSVNGDIEQNISEIRALLKINAEIFERCRSSASNHDDGKCLLFTRYGFDVVKVCHNKDTNQTQFITETERSQKIFDVTPLSELPAGLGGVFVVNYQAAPFNKFIDYGKFFQSALLLHDDVLEPFLAKLKCHIESIQVTLGEIETWLLEPKSNQEFLEATFGTKLVIPTDDDYLQECAHPEGTHASSDAYNNFIDDLLTARGSGDMSDFRDELDYVLVAQGITRALDRPLYNDSGSHRHPCYTFKWKRIHLLKSCEESGRFEKTFAIEKPIDRAKLKKFLEFMAIGIDNV